MMKKIICALIVTSIILCLFGCGSKETECDHNWIVWDQSEATCIYEGSIHYQCDKCLNMKQEIIPLSEHEFVLSRDYWTEATCTDSGLDYYRCKYCGYEEGRTVPALGHTEVTVDGTPASCKSSGMTSGIYCSKCYEWLLEQSTIPQLSHTYDDEYDAICNECGHERDAKCAHINKETLEGEAATCTKAGLTDGEKCLDCNEIVTAQETIDSLGHSESEWIIDKAATVSEDGSRHTECINCAMRYKTETLYATGSEGLEYSLNDDQTLSVVGYGGTDLNVFIPQYVDGRTVTSIEHNAFSDCSNLKSVTFLGDIYKIGMYAFARCSSLTEMILPDTVTYVGQLAFDGCSSMKYLYIPANLNDLGVDHSGNVYMLASSFSESFEIDVHPNNDSFKSVNGSLYSKNGEILYFASAKYLEKDENGKYDFVIPDGVVTVHTSAFYMHTYLKNVAIPKSVKTIEAYSFYYTYYLDSIYYNGTVSEWEQIVKEYGWSTNAGYGTTKGRYILYCQ